MRPGLPLAFRNSRHRGTGIVPMLLMHVVGYPHVQAGWWIDATDPTPRVIITSSLARFFKHMHVLMSSVFVFNFASAPPCCQPQCRQSNTTTARLPRGAPLFGFRFSQSSAHAISPGSCSCSHTSFPASHRRLRLPRSIAAMDPYQNVLHDIASGKKLELSREQRDDILDILKAGQEKEISLLNERMPDGSTALMSFLASSINMENILQQLPPFARAGGARPEL